MSNIFETETKIKQIIDELKALSAQAGLANQGEEERIIGAKANSSPGRKCRTYLSP